MRQTEEHYLKVYNDINRIIWSKKTECAPLVNFLHSALGWEYEDIINEMFVFYMTHSKYDEDKGKLFGYVLTNVRWGLITILRKLQTKGTIPRYKLVSLDALIEARGDSLFVKSDGRVKTKEKHE